ncbi:MAG: hypothetical protein KDD94_00650 [Calditrichaeota bacterium]|nr:hypothetical protein [Calditrichota bacterium]
MRTYLITGILMLTMVSAQIDTIKFDDGSFKMNQLNFGDHYYLVFMQKEADGPKSNFTIWKRSLRREKMDGKNYIHLDWAMDFGDPTKLVKENIYVDANTFRPQFETHLMRGMRGAGESRSSIRWQRNHVFSESDTLKHNSRQFDTELDPQTFNWQLDMETFSMLPYKLGKKFAINFYHPGSSVMPKYYVYTVSGEEKIDFAGREIDCWLISYDYDEKSHSTWWVDKKTFQVMKLYETSPYGIRYKIKIAADFFKSL